MSLLKFVFEIRTVFPPFPFEISVTFVPFLFDIPAVFVDIPAVSLHFSLDFLFKFEEVIFPFFLGVAIAVFLFFLEVTIAVRFEISQNLIKHF